MKIKTYKGYNDTTFIEVLEPLTLEDFIIEEQAPAFALFSSDVCARLTLTLKEEVAKHIGILLNDIDYWKPEKGKYTTFTKYFRREVKFNGCRSQKAKDKKSESVRQEMVVNMHDRKEARTNKLLETTLETIMDNLECMNNKYTTEVMGVMKGERMSSDFIKDNLDDKAIVDDLKFYNTQIAEIQEKKKSANEKLRIARNLNMLKYLSEKGWNDDDDEDRNNNVVVVPQLREELTKMYEEGEGFDFYSRNNHPIF